MKSAGQSEFSRTCSGRKVPRPRILARMVVPSGRGGAHGHVVEGLDAAGAADALFAIDADVEDAGAVRGEAIEQLGGDLARSLDAGAGDAERGGPHREVDPRRLPR